ncbi:hypothetical protein L1049_008428 [Liquidambar formosana]|uniref:Uncharacterized protein n=1 Tax=Liquidambar formosana TaxID=63359 RepID=A0AAP0X4K4_LIQFO
MFVLLLMNLWSYAVQDPAVEMSSNGECMEVSLGYSSVANHSSVEPSFGHGDYVVDDGQHVTLSEHQGSHNSVSACENNVQYGIHNGSTCNEVLVGEVSEQFKSSSTESKVQATESLDNDLFSQHFGNLSSALKIEGKKSSARRSYSARFVVRRDHYGGGKRLFDTSIQDSGGETLNCGEDSAPHVTLEDPSIPVLEERQIIDSFKKELEKATQSLLSPSPSLSQRESTKCSVTVDSMNMEVIELRDQKECIPEATEMQERVIACKEALISLDAAAESALQLFSKLGTQVSGEGISTGPAAQLYSEAAELLPLIAEKVHAVANLVPSSNIKTDGETGVEVPSFEPLLGTFAESLSHRVVQILKNNLSTL